MNASAQLSGNGHLDISVRATIQCCCAVRSWIFPCFMKPDGLSLDPDWGNRSSSCAYVPQVVAMHTVRRIWIAGPRVGD